MWNVWLFRFISDLEWEGLIVFCLPLSLCLDFRGHQGKSKTWYDFCSEKCSCFFLELRVPWGDAFLLPRWHRYEGGHKVYTCRQHSQHARRAGNAGGEVPSRHENAFVTRVCTLWGACKWRWVNVSWSLFLNSVRMHWIFSNLRAIDTPYLAWEGQVWCLL